MKIRQDFVTNSSSSSFILGFHSKEEIQNVASQLPDFLSEETIQRVVFDIESGITSKDEAVEVYRRSIWGDDFIFHGKDYWDMTADEINSEEYKQFINSEKDKLCNKFLNNELDQYSIISIVEYDDYTTLGELLEGKIIPSLYNTIRSISNH